MQDDPNIPDDLIHRLRSRVAPPVDVPGAVDEIILRGARTHLKRSRYRVLAWSTSVAASLLLGVGIGFYMTRPAPDPAIAIQTHDQPITILDALALARQGAASQTQVDQLAMRAVRLEDVR